MILYKYRSDSAFTHQIFSQQKVWLSTANQLNDPFEASLQEIVPEWTAEKVRAMKGSQFQGFLFGMLHAHKTRGDFFGLPHRKLKRLMAKFRRIKDADEAYEAFKAFMVSRGMSPAEHETVFPKLEAQLQEVGIFSLSEDCLNALMWAHYAGEHKGLCLGFEVHDGLPLGDRNRCLKVNYADSVPKLGEDFKYELTISFNKSGRATSSGRIALTDPAVQAAISTKAVCWSYEREWRYIEPSAGAFPWPGRLVELIFGLRCPSDVRDHYKSLVTQFVNNDVRVYEMQKIPNSNSLRRVSLLTLVKPTDRDEAKILDASLEASIARVGALLEAGQASAVLQMLPPLLSKHHNEPIFFLMRGVALGISQDHEGALNSFDEAIAMKSEYFSAWYHRGVALSFLGRLSEAVAAYERAKSLNPLDASTSFNLGAILHELERRDGAIVEFKRAERLGHPRAKYRLALLQSRV